MEDMGTVVWMCYVLPLVYVLGSVALNVWINGRRAHVLPIVSGALAAFVPVINIVVSFILLTSLIYDMVDAGWDFDDLFNFVRHVRNKLWGKK